MSCVLVLLVPIVLLWLLLSPLFISKEGEVIRKFSESVTIVILI
jgi:hypothetical protein